MEESFFKKLFEVNVEHNYYTEGKSHDFEISPTEECSRVLKNYGLLFKRTASGFVLFYKGYKDSASVIQPLKPVNKDCVYTFTVKLNNPFFVNFSELPVINKPEGIYYFDNLTLNKNAANELLLVDDTIKKYAGDKDAIVLKSSIYSYEVTTASPSSDLKILDKAGNILRDVTINNSGGKIKAQFDLTSLPVGVYKTTADGILYETFYKDPKLLYENIWGIIEIFKNSSVPADYRFADSAGNVTSKPYKITFQRRATFWKYIVINKYKLVTPGLNVQIGANPPISGVAHTLPDGTPATLFQVAAASDFTEVPVKNIKLSSNTDVLIDNLPNPDFEIIKPDLPANKVYSEIYVYI